MATVAKGRRSVARQSATTAEVEAPDGATVMTASRVPRHDEAASDSLAPVAGATSTLPDPLLTTIGTRIEAGSLVFDPEWYKQQYRDVAAAKLDPIRHYFDNGVREGRNPNAYFDTKWYASHNPDVAAAGLNPFLHYLLYGAREGRRPRPATQAV